MGALEKLVQEYPYFQMGRMLYLKNLHNENSIDYEKNLHITSAYAPSGKVLYNLIKKRVLKEEAGNENQKSQAFEEAVKISDQLSEASNEAISKNEILPKLEPVAILQEMPMNIKEDTSTTLSVTKGEPDEMQVLEKQMLREAYRTSMTIDLLQEEAVNPPAGRAGSQKSKDVKPINRSGAYSFGDWMKAFSEKAPELAKEDPSIPVAIGTGVTRKAKTEIIDSFILEETAKSAPKPKAEFYSAEVMAKKSLQDDETFVTETLARIYLKQGNLPKALRSYEILVVKYPEKIHIFAPLLEKIKKLLKDQNAK
jgi:hypothetical protein